MLSESGACFSYKVTEGIAIIYQVRFLEWYKGIFHINTFTFWPWGVSFILDFLLEVLNKNSLAIIDGV